MYLKKTQQQAGRIYMSIVDSYYDKTKKLTRQITVESLGYLDALEKEYEDPITFFNQKVEQLKIDKRLKNAPLSFEFFYSDKIELNAELRKNFGYAVLSKIYHELGIHTFLINLHSQVNVTRKRSEPLKL